MIFQRLPIPVLVALALLGGKAVANEHVELFNRLDQDSDGQLVEAEIPASEAALFQRLVRNADTDGDGQLSADEFQKGLTPQRPIKPLPEKVDTALPGSDALLLVLAWMDRNGDLTIRSNEVPPELKPLFNEFAELLNLGDRSRVRIPQLRQQAMRYAGMASRYAAQGGIDVEVELALLTDKQWAFIERLRTSLRPGEAMSNPENALLLFAGLDTDGDGNVTAEEVPEPYSERFAGLIKRADRNQDKQLSEEEFKSFNERIASLESNRLSPTETKKGLNQLLRRADRDGDRQLDRGEAPPKIANRFDRFDENGDEKLDSTELANVVEILAALRNSAGFRQTSVGTAAETPQKSGEN